MNALHRKLDLSGEEIPANFPVSREKRFALDCILRHSVSVYAPKAFLNRHFARAPINEPPKSPVFFPVSREFGGE